jgi:hypothetical protein
VATSSAIVHQPAATLQSAPRAVRHRANTSTTANAPRYMCRHQPGVPLKPTNRAVSAGTLWVATSCCCSPTAPRKPSACTPKPSTPTSATPASARHALSAMPTRSRVRGEDSTRKGSIRPAVSLMPTPAASAAAAPRGWVPARGAPAEAVVPAAARRELVPALSASAPAIASSSSVSLWAPPTASANVTGFSPTNAAAHAGERPRRPAALAISATAASVASTAIALYAHNPPASPSGTSA